MGNRVELSGIVTEKPKFKFLKRDEGAFFEFFISVERDSGTKDVIPVLVSEKQEKTIKTDDYLNVVGAYQSYNKDGHLLLSVFAEDIKQANDFKENQIRLSNAVICKEPVYRITPRGRYITELLVAIPRENRKSDYIPCLSWGENAFIARELKVGDQINIIGRIQSREYLKKLNDQTIINKTAYEVSIRDLEVISNDESED